MMAGAFAIGFGGNMIRSSVLFATPRFSASMSTVRSSPSSPPRPVSVKPGPIGGAPRCSAVRITSSENCGDVVTMPMAVTSVPLLNRRSRTPAY